jgi:NAD(P)-dependent dehydrogenase (short-subunit alcohol dehydrogenase family)
MYNSTKAAVGTLYETLKIELAQFNICVFTLNPGSFKTNILANTQMPSNGPSKHYLKEAVVCVAIGLVGSSAHDSDASMPSDLAKFGDGVVEIVDGTSYGENLHGKGHSFLGREGLSLVKRRLD